MAPAPATPAANQQHSSRLPIMTSTTKNTSTARKRTSTSPPRTIVAGGTFTAAPSAKRSPIGTRSRLSLVPGPSSPLATPPRRPSGGRLLDAYGGVQQHQQQHQNQSATNQQIQATPKRKLMSDRIKVCVRKRPILNGDGQDCIAASPRQQRVMIHQEKAGLDGISRVPDQHTFHFDHVFDEAMTNEQVFRVCVEPLLNCFWDGGKATCFA